MHSPRKRVFRKPDRIFWSLLIFLLLVFLVALLLIVGFMRSF